MHENEGGALSQDMLNSKIATGCTQSEFALRVNKINENKTQEHLVTNPANRRVPGKPGTSPLTTEFLAHPFLQSNSRITNRKDKVKKLIEQFESHPFKESFLQDFEPDAEDQ